MIKVAFGRRTDIGAPETTVLTGQVLTHTTGDIKSTLHRQDIGKYMCEPTIVLLYFV